MLLETVAKSRSTIAKHGGKPCKKSTRLALSRATLLLAYMCLRIVPVVRPAGCV
ncbi:hypothetical protein P167DRAFT_30029 [Morchella conica CCBAS932]|uniref:Uncharacterized protein n=1 Tax=Morchella conica CCBAS932 TaxID=1392247 RepID=A0A3N4KWS4_9PEZI|nr:hypothetical protein P167DRAFT_30029 [Morchella conica CCBAS932]